MADNHTDERVDDTTSSPQADWDVEAAPVREPEHARPSPEVDAERERLVAERAARREARLAALAPEPEPDPVPVAEAAPRYAPSGPVASGATAASVAPARVAPETVTVTQRTTDRFAGSLGLFLLRLVTAGIIGFHGLNHLLNLPATTRLIQSTVLPAPGILAIVLGAAEVAIAIALVFGLLTRLAGLGLALVAGGALAFVQWGASNPFVPGQDGFTGELELLLVAVGLLFMLVGAGGWSVDHGFRARRQESRDL